MAYVQKPLYTKPIYISRGMLDIEQYDYELPEALIRKQGVEPRDSARLLVYDTARDTVTHARFSQLADFLPPRSLLVLNDTRVVPARLHLTKETGGKIEVFVLVNERHSLLVPLMGEEGGLIAPVVSGDRETRDAREIPVLVDRKCLLGWKLSFPNGDFFEVTRQEENKFFVILRSQESLETLLDRYGETPIPPYLEEAEKNESVLRARYQTIFAQSGASVAAPTASLHFTERVLASLDARGIECTSVTLDVGLGTFAPLREEQLSSKKLHREYITVSSSAAGCINTARENGRLVIPVGTTALRTLETIGKTGEARAYTGETDIFIYPPYRFQVAGGLVTNFHLPKSSLMLLVDALLEHKGARRRILNLYRIAIDEGYAFYSFGDSMLIL